MNRSSSKQSSSGRAYAWVRWCVALLAAVQLGGCARPSRFLAPFEREPTPAAENLLAPLRRTARPVQSLRFKARVSAWQSARPGRLHFEALAGIQPPDKLRLRAYRSATIKVFDLLASGTELRLYDALGDNYFAADYARLQRAGSLWSGFTPALLIQGLTVEQTVLDRAAAARAVAVSRHWSTFELRLDNADARVRVYFSRRSRRIESIAYEGRGAEGTARIRYGELIDVEGVRLPTWIELEHQPTRIRLRLELTEYKINEHFTAATFTLQAPAGKPWLPLEDFK